MSALEALVAAGLSTEEARVIVAFRQLEEWQKLAIERNVRLLVDLVRSKPGWSDKDLLQAMRELAGRVAAH